MTFSYWGARKIKWRFCKPSEYFIWHAHLKELIKLSLTSKNQRPPPKGYITMTGRKLKLKKWWDIITGDWLFKINFTKKHWVSYEISKAVMVSDDQNFIAFHSNKLWLISLKITLWLTYYSNDIQYTHHMTWNFIFDSVM